MSSDKVILVTGGAGFIGISLVKYLLNNDPKCTVIVVDNFITANQQTFLNTFFSVNNRINLLEMDICSPTFLQTVQAEYPKIDEIYHLASLASPKFYQRFPIETLDVGYVGTKNVLELMVYYQQNNVVCKMLFASTSEVYGDALEHPQKETYYGNVNTVGNRSCYDSSKRVAESLIHTFRQVFKLDTRIVRIFNTYGPYMNIDDGRIVTEIIKGLLYNKPLTIFGDGSQTRSLSYVSDTVYMITKVMESDFRDPVNVGNNQEISVMDLVNTAQKLHCENFTENELSITFKPIDKDDPKTRQPCLELNRRVIGNFERTTLDQGLLETIKYFHNQK